ncbi:hypothetical protein [Mesorhizobium sp. M0323]|uniref:hypothetical protein n=1 Tax=Mesorhizobium sp. M0323 TaxID=2956938 RepID=UPI00333D03D9
MFEFALEQAEDAVRGDEAANALDRLELLDPTEQLASEALLAGTKEIDHVAAELEEVGQAGAVARDASAAEENDVA